MALNNYVMFAASQGGHFTELMYLHSLFAKFNSVLVTDNLSANKNDTRCSMFKEIEYSRAWADRRLNTGGITKTKNRWQNFGTYLKMFIECFKIYRKYKPSIVISTGSYIAVPLFLCAKIYHAKTIYIESNARVFTKSTTGMLVEKLSDKFYVQWPELLRLYSNAEYHGLLQ